MRWLFLFVFSLNFAYIGWEMSKSPSDDYAAVPQLKNIQRIVLLSELKQQQESAVDAEQLDDNVETADIDERSTGQVSEKQVVLEQVAEKTTEAEKDLAQPPEVKADKTEIVAVVAKPVGSEATPTPTAATKSEPVKPEPEKPDSVKSKPAKPGPAKPLQQASCYTLGPFRDLIKLSTLTREIKSYVVTADFRGREEKEQTLYWVYVKPEKNRKQAVAAGKRLKAKKIKDFYIIREGEKINGLSLGHFRSKDGAYGLAKKVRKLGFDVIVEPVFKTYTVYWLDYQLTEGAVIPEEIFDTYLKSTKKDKISRLSRECS